MKVITKLPKTNMWTKQINKTNTWTKRNKTNNVNKHMSNTIPIKNRG